MYEKKDKVRRPRRRPCFLAASACVVWGQAGGLGKGRSVDVEAAQVEAAGLTGDDYEGWNALLAENEISEDFREGLAGFAFQSGSAVLSEAEDNAFFSPLSLYYALAVLGTGAEGETEAELLAALGAEGRRIWPVSARRSFSGMCTRKKGCG